MLTFGYGEVLLDLDLDVRVDIPGMDSRVRRSEHVSTKNWIYYKSLIVIAIIVHL